MGERIWLVTFVQCDLGYFDDETCRLESIENPFGRCYPCLRNDGLSATSMRHAPWHVVPADDKYNARLIISRVVIDALHGLTLRDPGTTHARRRELRAIRRQLAEKRA